VGTPRVLPSTFRARQAAYFRYGHDVVVPGKVGMGARSAARVLSAKRKRLALFRGGLT
jgi:hypothetical protein